MHVTVCAHIVLSKHPWVLGTYRPNLGVGTYMEKPTKPTIGLAIMGVGVYTKMGAHSGPYGMCA